jgi:hypothetical protein
MTRTAAVRRLEALCFYSYGGLKGSRLSSKVVKVAAKEGKCAGARRGMRGQIQKRTALFLERFVLSWGSSLVHQGAHPSQVSTGSDTRVPKESIRRLCLSRLVQAEALE